MECESQTSSELSNRRQRMFSRSIIMFGRGVHYAMKAFDQHEQIKHT